jgi:threonylcarbamoyladenosine tRNA methylthiotransferase MtaB
MGAPRVAVVNLGCRVNRSESDAIERGLAEAGVDLVDEASAQAVVINTCAVTAEATSKARSAVRRASRLAGVRSVVVTGCAASLFSDEFESLGTKVVVEPDKSRVVGRVLVSTDGMAFPPSSCDARRVGTPLVDASHALRPSIKVQDGCDRRCTYCIVWKARGPACSVEADDVVHLVDDAVCRGAREVVLAGIDISAYSSVHDGRPLGLAGLVDLILERTSVGRVRLSSVEPGGLGRDLLAVMSSSCGRVAPFLHVPLQSGCDATLSRMGRTYAAADYARAIDTARGAVEGLAVACDVIVGFPGETDAEFEASLSFCSSCDFSRMHVFRYSRRPGTPAASSPAQVPSQVSSTRAAAMRDLSDCSRQAFVGGLVGRDLFAFVERPGRATSGELVRVAVDRAIPCGSLVRVRAHGLLPSLCLDARTGA